MKKQSLIILGPSLKAVSGVSTHLNQIIGSNLSLFYNIIHFQVGSEGRNENFSTKLKRFLFSPIELALLIINEKPAILHINTSMDKKGFTRDIFYLFVSSIFGIHTIYQIHGGAPPNEFFKNRKLLLFLFKMLCKLPEAVVVLSRDLHTAYRKLVPLEKLFLIPNAIDLRDYQYDGEKEFCAPHLKLVYIGRIDYKKGIQDVIKAISLLKSSDDDQHVLFDIAGSGKYEEPLRAMVHSLSLDNEINFVGPVFGKSKLKFWQEAHIFAFPTFHNEGLPYAILESLASGTPVITTHNQGIADAIHDEIHGIFVRPHSPEAIACAIKNLASNRDKLKIMSNNCIHRAEQQYGMGRLTQQFKRLYLDIAKQSF